MNNKIVTLLVFLIFGFAQAQQLNCTVTINTERLPNPNQQVFKTLQTSLSEFVNKTDWTGSVLKQNERINCSMYITLSSNSSDQFSGTIQVQSSRLIYNSTYSSPVFNFNDKDFSFRYTEYEPLLFNPTTFESNLVSVVSFYSYVILGMDADTFQMGAGSPYFETALNIANVAQQGGSKGWSQADGVQNRYFLINDMVSPTYSDLRQTMFLYHTGLDGMSQDLKVSKEKIKNAVVLLGKLNSVKPNAFLTRVFFDAKSDEIVSVFSGGPSIPITDLTDVLNKVSPLNSTKWSQINF
ncbi:type IX secretion system protein PorD [Pseudomonas shirazensis]